MARHELTATAKTVNWGYYCPKKKPVLTAASGDTVVIHAEPGVRTLEGPIEKLASPELRDIVENGERDLGGHILTGPVAVQGAMPGDVLEVRIRDVRLRYDWGFNVVRPLLGGLPEDFPHTRLVIVKLDAKAGTGDWGAGVKVPLAPFFGNFGVAPPPSMGRVPSMPPGVWGGNLDNKELGAGATVYFPVFVEGALFAAGDGHGCQGDGESCLSAIETAMTGEFELIVRKDMKLSTPRAETAAHWIFMGFDPLLDNAAKMALRETISFLGELKGMSRDDAYTLCSLAVDLRVTQIVNGVKGVHAMLPKALFG
ncbi:MAG: acetamidase/formamidase family protein [Candidatus Tectomicrobia bacterium]|uniref:Acetamidase/formamidase family protein n=1 Tax=Tectimicrobiota bacterium TaxID=2528274 RepID=A0A932I0M8_UNCTE|nr:acetamidase/formamidase family protein [Candidatus Tectomicrobia bacterium]